MMTREEAIINLEKLIALFHTASEQSKMVDYSKIIETLEFAAAALRPISREQVEKVWRGEWEWYDEEVGSPLEGIEREWGWRCSKCKTVLPDEFDNPDDSPAMRFCQWCGAPITDEAVKMVMERLEAIHNDC